MEADSAYVDRWIREIREALGAEAFEAARAEGATMVYEQAVRYASDQVLAR